jgi:hypothetical protein
MRQASRVFCINAPDPFLLTLFSVCRMICLQKPNSALRMSPAPDTPARSGTGRRVMQTNQT